MEGRGTIGYPGAGGGAMWEVGGGGGRGGREEDGRRRGPRAGIRDWRREDGSWEAAVGPLRAALPRPRYDQVMAGGWKFCLPLAVINMLVTAAFVLSNP